MSPLPTGHLVYPLRPAAQADSCSSRAHVISATASSPIPRRLACGGLRHRSLDAGALPVAPPLGRWPRQRKVPACPLDAVLPDVLDDHQALLYQHPASARNLCGPFDRPSLKCPLVEASKSRLVVKSILHVHRGSNGSRRWPMGIRLVELQQVEIRNGSTYTDRAASRFLYSRRPADARRSRDVQLLPAARRRVARRPAVACRFGAGDRGAAIASYAVLATAPVVATCDGDSLLVPVSGLFAHGRGRYVTRRRSTSRATGEARRSWQESALTIGSPAGVCAGVACGGGG
jgi:hypothetical protein